VESPATTTAVETTSAAVESATTAAAMRTGKANRDCEDREKQNN
jgi:hypothetical protein